MPYTHWNESGYCVYGSDGHIDFDGTCVDEDAVDVFLYKLYGKRGDNDEFWERYYHGKKIVANFSKDFYIQRLSVFSNGFDEQADAISALARTIWRECYTPLLGAAQVEYMLEKYQSPQQICTDIEKNDYEYFTAKAGEKRKLIGYCGIVTEDGGLRLSKLYVRKDCRGHGIARKFLDAVVTLCKTYYDLNKIRLTVDKNNKSAITTFKKLGFAIAGAVKSDIGGGFFMDDYMMELAIKGADKKPTNNYADEELAEARLTLEYVLRECEKTDSARQKESLRPLCDRRITALEIALSLINLKMGSSSRAQKPAD